MDDNKMGPSEFSDAFFNMLQAKSNASPLPWMTQTYGEDRWSAEEAMRALYTKLGLKHPRFAWASSPRAMFEAINLLRTMRGQREKVIDSLIPNETALATEEDVRRTSAARVVLDAMLDRDLLVTVGAPLLSMLGQLAYKRRPDAPPAVVDLSMRFAKQTFISQGGPGSLPGPPTSDVTIYPALHSEFIGPVSQQVFCMAPYLKVCWFSLPPTTTELYDDGHLERVVFSDGFHVSIPKFVQEFQFAECLEAKDDRDKHEACPYRIVIADGFKYTIAVCTCEHHNMTPEECEEFYKKHRQLPAEEAPQMLSAPESEDESQK